jgi:hypothetical protein
MRNLQVSAFSAKAYRFFSVEIIPEGNVLRLHKSTGSQRLLGLVIMTVSGAHEFLGAAYYAGKLPRHHSSMDSAQADPSADREGILLGLGPRRYLLMLSPQKKTLRKHSKLSLTGHILMWVDWPTSPWLEKWFP